jgi:preprotein translocase subunit Sss1
MNQLIRAAAIGVAILGSVGFAAPSERPAP